MSFDLTGHRVSNIVSDAGAQLTGNGSWCDLVIFSSDRSSMTICLHFEDAAGIILDKAIKEIWPR